MKTYENKNFKVTINKDGKMKITKKNFNDVFFASIDKENKIHAHSALGLKYAMTVREQFGF